VVGVQQHVEQRKLDLAQRLHATLEIAAASILSNSARGSGSPVSTWAVMWRSTFHSQQKFSMNWLGSSTASHSTPLMPDTWRSLTWVSRWCSPWPNSWNSVMTSSWVSSAVLHVHTRPRRSCTPDGPPASAVLVVRPQPAAAHIVHPGATALAMRVRRVQVKLPDQRWPRVASPACLVALDAVELHAPGARREPGPGGSPHRTGSRRS
jgi:hypothetical protein